MSNAAPSTPRDKVVWRSDPTGIGGRSPLAMLVLALGLAALLFAGLAQTVLPKAADAVGLAHRDFPSLLIGGGLGITAALAWMLARFHLMRASHGPHRLAATHDALLVKGRDGVDRIPLSEIAGHSFKSGVIERCVLELTRGGRRTIILDGHPTETHRHLHRLLTLDAHRRDAAQSDAALSDAEIFPDSAPTSRPGKARSEFRRSFSEEFNTPANPRVAKDPSDAGV